MMNQFAFEALDRTLQDIMRNGIPFGEKVVVIAGDFHQIPPVIRKGTPLQIVAASIKSSNLWENFEIMQLTINVRVQLQSGQEASELQNFSNFLLQVGAGEGGNNFVIPSGLRSQANSIDE